MYAVGRLSNYISQGVYSVAAPFHPFGGAVDIIVVQQEDGTFKCSPWYVKFGKFQGVLKRREKIVTVGVNGEEAGFHMYLDHKGEAYFLKEVDSDEEENSIFSPPSAPSSGDEVVMEQLDDGKTAGDTLRNSPPSDSIMVCESNEETLISFPEKTPSSIEKQIESQSLDNSDLKSFSSNKKNGVKNGTIVSKPPSRKKSIFSYVFRRSRRLSEVQVTASDTNQNDGHFEGNDYHRRSSLESAEIIANLLDSKWATGDSANMEETAGDKLMEMNSFSTSPADKVNKEGTMDERSIEMNSMSTSSGYGADKDETVGGQSVAMNSISSSSAYDAQPLEQTKEKTYSADACSSGGSADKEDFTGERSMEMDSFSTSSGDSGDKEETLGEKSVGMNSISSSSAADAQPLEQTKEKINSDDALSSLACYKDSGNSIAKQVDAFWHNDLKKQDESTQEDSVQVICNHDGGSTVENCAFGNGKLEHSIQHINSETYQFQMQTDIFSMEGSLNEYNKFGKQTSGNDVAQDSENSIPDQEYMISQDIAIPNAVEPYNFIANVESSLGTFNEFSELTFANDAAYQIGNSLCDHEHFSSPQLKNPDPIELSASSTDMLLTCIDDSQDPIAAHISSLDLASEVSALSCHVLGVAHDSESCQNSQIIITMQQLVDDAHLQFSKCTSDDGEQMEHKEKQEEGMQQFISLVEPVKPSCDCNTSITLSDIHPASSYLSGSLLVSGDDSDPCAETDEGTTNLRQVPDAAVEVIIGGDDERGQNKCRTSSDKEVVFHVILQNELDRSLCDYDTLRENRTPNQTTVPGEASNICGCLLDRVGDPNPCTESNEETMTLQQVPDIALKPVIEGSYDEIEKDRSITKPNEEVIIPVTPPPKELVGSSFCDFDTSGENRADQTLVPKEAFSYTNTKEDMIASMNCDNLIDSKLGNAPRANLQTQYDLSASVSVSKQYEVRKLDFVFRSNSFLRPDECCVQTKETYPDQMAGNESREDIELTFNDEYDLNSCLALSDPSPPTKEGTREHDLPLLIGQTVQVGRQNGNDYPNEDVAFSDRFHDKHHTLPTLNVNVANATDDCNLEYSNGNASQVSRNETIPINIPRLHMEDKGDAMRDSCSLPNLGNHFLDIENIDADCVYSRSLGCLKQGTSHENHFPNSQNTESRTFEKESVKDWSAREASSESLKNWNITETAIASVQPYTGIELSLCRHLLFEGMGSDAAAQAFDSLRVSVEQFHISGAAVTKNENLVVKIGDRYFPWDAAAPIILGMVAFGVEGPVQSEGAIPVERVEKALARYASDSFVTPSGGWRLWPFSFRKSKIPQRSYSAQTTPINDLIGEPQTALQDSFDGSLNDYYRKSGKRKMRSNTPTSEQLASLNLKEGQNLITFTFSTRVLGKQQVDARIYLWKWNTRIVVSDVDGTITKSDVLGQFMPLVGKDWTQSGVAHLFSAIKDNGYQLLFLSARAIAQAYLTRQFLLNIKQDGKALPDGPIVISPDGLFPSLYREVIRRAPHEFKIACLEDIRKLFPSDSNPFYAGFGNRNTDEISYLKVGIPKGKIFIINPKGEVAVNHRVDTKSYTSLHKLVNGMFPAMSSSEQ
ncbi:hypothetical protein KI387_015491, partial [Taxus chinensis]